MSWIVVEALDGVGKTTLCAGLARALGARVMDTPGPALRPVREQILQALGPDEAARALFYAATVQAEGGEGAGRGAGGDGPLLAVHAGLRHGARGPAAVVGPGGDPTGAGRDAPAHPRRAGAASEAGGARLQRG